MNNNSPLPQICVCSAPLAVVLRILPHSQPGPERLRVLLQDQRAEKEVAGAVQHGHVSVFVSCGVCVRAWQSDKAQLLRHQSAHIYHPVIQVSPLHDL